MPIDNSAPKEELIRQIQDLPAEMIKEILDYTYYLKARDVIDTSQAYFWTTRWQTLEKKADADKTAGKSIGDGTVAGLLAELKK